MKRENLLKRTLWSILTFTFFAFLGNSNNSYAQSINPTMGYYSLSEPSDVVFNIEWGPATDIYRVVYGYWDDVNQVYVETNLVNSTDYTYNSTNLTIKNSFISSLNPTPGALQFHVDFLDNFNNIYNYWFDIYVVNTLNPEIFYSTITYDLSNPEDIINIINFNFATEITSVTVNSVPLSPNDYEVQGFWIKFKESWLQNNFPTSGLTKNVTLQFDYGDDINFMINSIQTGFTKATLMPNYHTANNSTEFIESIINWNSNISVENLEVFYSEDGNYVNTMDYPFYNVIPLTPNSALLHIDFMSKNLDKSYIDNFFALIKVNFDNNQSSYIYLEFFDIYYEITTVNNPNWGGWVSGNGFYSEGEQVTIEAFPNTNYSFVKFDIPGIGEITQNPYSFNMPAQDIYITAYFLSDFLEVIDINPQDGDINVSVMTDFTITFNRPIQEYDPGNSFDNITFFNMNTGIYENVNSINIQDQNKLKIIFNTPLNFSTNYLITIPQNTVSELNNINNTLNYDLYVIFKTEDVSGDPPSVSPNSQYFFLNNPSDVTFQYNVGYGIALNNIIRPYWDGNDYVNDTLVEDIDYTKTSNTITIKSSYINSLNPQSGNYIQFYANFINGSAYFGIQVLYSDHSFITPNHIDYDLSNPQDLFTWLLYYENDSFQSLVFNSNTLTEGVQYDIYGNLLFIKNSFISNYLTAVGNSINLTINFTSGDSDVLTINSIQTGIQNATINPSFISLNENNMPEYIETIITWNSASSVTNLNVITVSGQDFQSNDYNNYQVIPINSQTATLKINIEGKKSHVKTIEKYYVMVEINFNQGSPAYLLIEIIHEYYEVSIQVYPENSGYVMGNANYNPGESVTLQAFANTGYVFNSWKKNGIIISTDNPYLFNMPAEDLNLIAYFVPEGVTLYQVSANVNPAGAGIVTGEGNYPQGENVTLTAIPNSGFAFVSWTDENSNVISNNASYTFNMPESDITYTANFVDISSVNDQNLHNVKVYPNPFNDLIRIHSDIEIVQISVINATGQILLTTKDNIINTINLPAGLYILNIKLTNGNLILHKVIKQ